MADPCSIDHCGRPRRWRDLCNAHSARLLRTGVRGGPIATVKPRIPKTCNVTECEQRVYCGGMCTKHYQQQRNRGTVNPERIVGPEHHSWQGDDVAYRTVHTRLQAELGKAADRACVDCCGPALHWSYDYQSDTERDSPSGPYTTDLDHYQPRCPRCHKALDQHRTMVPS